MDEEKRTKEVVQERLRRGVWHDPRMGAVAGGGVLAELGIGDEPFGENDEDLVGNAHQTDVSNPTSVEERKGTADLQVVSTLPTVVLKNYAAGSKEDIMDIFAKWAAALVEGQVRPSHRLGKKADNEMTLRLLM